MVDLLLAVGVGALTGVLSGCGVGGGPLLLLWLTLAAGLDQFHAGAVNLLYFVACAVPAVWTHLRRGLPEKRAVGWCVLAGLPACGAGALLASVLDVALLRRFFGVFLLFIALRELFSRSGNKPPVSGHPTGQTNELEGTK